MARDLGMCVSEFVDIASSRAEWPDLLHRRMAILGIAADDVAAAKPGLFEDMQRRCTLCTSRRQCMLDFIRTSDNPAWLGWRDYCPNAATLNMLSVLHLCAKPAAESGQPRA
jgi:hypothetical protein